MRRIPLVLPILVLWCGAVSAAAATPKDLVKVKLLADVASVKPGHPFTAGVLLTIKPEWHVYWKYPGDSGAPTKVKWNLPDGWTAGELQFPVPIRFDQPGEVLGIGYKDEVLLTATITPPANLPTDKPAEIRADVSWLVCETVCIPGKAAETLSLPVSGDATPANAESFAKWGERMPKSSPQKAAAERGADGTIKVSHPTPAGAKALQWFAVPPEGSAIEDAQTSDAGGVSSMSFTLAPPPKGAAEMQFVLAYTQSNGKRQGEAFNVNVPPVAGK